MARDERSRGIGCKKRSNSVRVDSDFDVTILGAGIAGLSAARSLSQKGLKVLLLDKSDPGSGASGAPLALLNPATGRRAKKAWQAEKCIKKTTDVLKDLQKKISKPVFAQNSVLRPAIVKDLAKNFRESPEKYDWPDTWVEWLDKDQIKTIIPGAACHEGGLKISPAATVHLPNYIKASVIDLQETGIRFIRNTNSVVEKSEKRWIIKNDDYKFSSSLLLHAAGQSIANFIEWDFMNLELVKGQTLTLYFHDDIPFQCSLSAMGYIAQLPDYPKMLVIGSTYEHSFNHADPDSEGKDYLLKKFRMILPGLSNKIRGSEQWSGVRVSSSNYLPVIGEHPQIKNLFVFTGLGSKGLLYGQHCADLLADHIINQTPLPAELSPSRFQKK